MEVGPGGTEGVQEVFRDSQLVEHLSAEGARRVAELLDVFPQFEEVKVNHQVHVVETPNYLPHGSEVDSRINAGGDLIDLLLVRRFPEVPEDLLRWHRQCQVHDHEDHREESDCLGMHDGAVVISKLLVVTD